MNATKAREIVNNTHGKVWHSYDVTHKHIDYVLDLYPEDSLPSQLSYSISSSDASQIENE